MIYTTQITAIDPVTGELTLFCGPDIEALSPKLAHEYCQLNGLGYCQVTGRLVSEIPCDEDYKPDFNNEINYDIQLN